MLLGHELLDDNITKVTHQLLQRQSQDEGSRAPSMRRICGFQLVTTCDDSVDQKFWCHVIWKIHICSLNCEFGLPLSLYIQQNLLRIEKLM